MSCLLILAPQTYSSESASEESFHTQQDIYGGHEALWCHIITLSPIFLNVPFISYLTVKCPVAVKV